MWKDSFIFKIGSFFRPVNMGVLENDYENITKFRYGILKYINQNKDKAGWDSSNLSKMKYKGPLYFMYVPASFVLASAFFRKSSYAAIMATSFVSILSFQRYYHLINFHYQCFLSKNYSLLEENIHKALISGDARYLRAYTSGMSF